MCFRPPTADRNDPVCPVCGHENFIGVTKCAKCGATDEAAPVGTGSAASRDWTPGLDFEQQGAPKAPGAPKPPSAPSAPKPL